EYKFLATLSTEGEIVALDLPLKKCRQHEQSLSKAESERTSRWDARMVELGHRLELAHVVCTSDLPIHVRWDLAKAIAEDAVSRISVGTRTLMQRIRGRIFQSQRLNSVT